MIAHCKCRQKSQRSGQLHSPKCVWLIFVDHLSEINPYSIATKIERGQIHFEVALDTVHVWAASQNYHKFSQSEIIWSSKFKGET